MLFKSTFANGMELGHDLPLSQEPAGQKALVINRGTVVLNTAAGEICISVIEDV